MRSVQLPTSVWCGVNRRAPSLPLFPKPQTEMCNGRSTTRLNADLRGTLFEARTHLTHALGDDVCESDEAPTSAEVNHRHL
jgi:hypothetical protein